MTQPQLGRTASPAVAAIQNASVAALVMAVVAVGLMGTGAAVAIDRTAGSSNSSTPRAVPGTPGGPLTQISPGPLVSPTSSPAAHPASDSQQALKALLEKTFANALRLKTVHSVARNVTSKGTAVFVDDDAANGGTQHITIYGGHIQIRVVGSTTYFTGDRRGLKQYFRFSDGEVTALKQQWIPLVSGQAGYQAITAGVTLSSTLEADRIAGHLTREPEKTIDDQQVFGISGDAFGEGAPKGAHATMWIGVESGLPVEFDADNGKQQLTQTFSDWGKPIDLKAPANVVGQPGSSI